MQTTFTSLVAIARLHTLPLDDVGQINPQPKRNTIFGINLEMEKGRKVVGNRRMSILALHGNAMDTKSGLGLPLQKGISSIILS
jgi:hypothetical protein